MEEVLRHLVFGWQGFLIILASQTSKGVAFSAETLDRLEQMQQTLTEVITKQRQLAKGK